MLSEVDAPCATSSIMNLVLNSLEPELNDGGASEAFYSRALPRIRRFMIGLAIPVAAFVLLRFGWKIDLGFLNTSRAGYSSTIGRIMAAVSLRCGRSGRIRPKNSGTGLRTTDAI